MGWITYSSYRFNLKIDINLKDSILFFIVDDSINRIYLITEQSEKNLYNFIVCDDIKVKKEFKLKSNIELFKLIIEYNACNNQYQRHFNINKILK